MSMVIGTNISSLTAQRHLETSRADLNQSMERLSSGQRINSAMDDAAGLAISDRMDSQVNGLSQAVRNANDAISLGQTAEGALGETTAILQRMRDLSVQSGNSTNTSADRTAMQTEVATLQAELTRISTASTFNDQALLDGSFTSSAFQIGHKASDSVNLSISGMGAADLNKVEAVTGVAAESAVKATSVLTFTGAAVAGNNTTVTVGTATLSYDFVAADFATAGSETVTEAATAFTTAWNASTDANVAAYTASSSAGAVTFTQDIASDGALTSSVKNTAVAGTAVESSIAVGNTGLVAVTAIAAVATLTVGATLASGDGVNVSIGDANFTFNHTATVTAAAYAALYITAWNNNTDAEVSKFTASRTTTTSVAVVLTQDTAATGALTVSETVNGTMAATSIAATTTGVAAVTAVKATATQTFATAAAANEVVETTVGGAVFSYDFGATAMTDVGATATAFATAWNASTDTNVDDYVASVTTNNPGVVTYTQATAAATNIKAQAKMTIAGTTIKADDQMSMSVTNTSGTGTLAHTFTTSGLTLTQNAEQYVAAWNASTDAGVSLFTASNAAGVITLTEDVATTGVLSSLSSSITQAGAGSNLVETTAVATLTTGISALTVGTVDGGINAAAAAMAAGTTGNAAVDAVTAVTGSSVNTLDISTASGATAAITSLDLAIAEVGAERAKLGAFQNRLEHTVSNLSSMIENTSAARSRIQDADFAVESANLAKNQVMQQAGTAMLAQANASSQGVLSLLK